jgi:anti-sigma regulatory factor (Ser/Thr protein kinase)
MDTLFSFGPDPGSAQLARNIVRRVLDDQPDDVRETAALLTSELVTNAVIHTQHPFELNVERLDDRIRVTVADASPAEPVVRDIDPARERGQGMIIVRALATVWGVGRHPNGKSVWFVLRLPSANGKAIGAAGAGGGVA